ncbi:MAG: hypothetical protein ACSHWY_00350 [Octadecabacter sp.]
MTSTANPSQTKLERIQCALEAVAKLVVDDPVYAPIFERLERMLENEQALQSGGVIARAKAIAAQSATL